MAQSCMNGHQFINYRHVNLDLILDSSFLIDSLDACDNNQQLPKLPLVIFRPSEKDKKTLTELLNENLRTCFVDEFRLKAKGLFSC